MMSLTVCGRTEAALLLTLNSYHLVVSIGSPGEDELPGLRQVQASGGHVLRPRFDDVDREQCSGWYVPPQAHDVRDIVQFAPHIYDGPSIVHCAAGISRSTAAALVMLTVNRGAGSEVECCRELVQYCTRNPYEIHPNRRIVWLADRILRRDGRLYEAAAESFGFKAGFETEPDAGMLEVWT